MIDPRFLDALEYAADGVCTMRPDCPTRRRHFERVLLNFQQSLAIPGRYIGRPGRNVDVFEGQCTCVRKWMMSSTRGRCRCGMGIEVEW